MMGLESWSANSVPSLFGFQGRDFLAGLMGGFLLFGCATVEDTSGSGSGQGTTQSGTEGEVDDSGQSGSSDEQGDGSAGEAHGDEGSDQGTTGNDGDDDGDSDSGSQNGGGDNTGSGAGGNGETDSGGSSGDTGGAGGGGSGEITGPACRSPEVSPGSNSYDRFEGTGFSNACMEDADCFRGGCSNEICSADSGVSGTCDVPSNPPQGSCGCVAGECLWYTNDCACDSDSDCRTHSGYCSECVCYPLKADDPSPFCDHITVSCMVDPCEGKSAVCREGQCALAEEP